MTTRFYRPLLLGDGIHVSAARTPRKVAIRCGEASVDFATLDARVRRVAAHAIARLGLRPGDRVALFAPNCLEYPEIMAGLTDAGVIVATINPRASSAELAAACADCGARLLVAHATNADTAAAALLPTVERRLVIGGSGEDAYEAWRDAPPAAVDLPRLDETDPFTLVYSSGTTGKPKGILLSHRSRVLTFHAMGMEYGCFGPDDRFLAFAPMAHGAGFAFAMAPLYFGGSIDVLTKFDAGHVVELLASRPYTGVFMVPTHFQAIFALEPTVLERHRGQARTLRAIISNAAALPQAIKEKIVAYWGEGLLHETYGSTEAGIVTNIRPADQLRKIQSVGRPFATTEVRLLDDAGNEVPVGEVGELFSRGPYAFNGYWNQPQATLECSREGGWISAGDLARRDEDGCYYIVDRKKDMVISGGINIFPREIEEVLHRHPAVVEAAVVGVPDDYWGEKLRAFVVPRAGAGAVADPGALAEALAEHCRGQLSAYKVPREIRFIDALPRNAGGKVLKKDLRALP